MGLLSSIFKSLLPGKSGGRRRKKKRRSRVKLAEGGGFNPSGAGPQSRVLVANLFGSGGKEVSERLVGIVSRESGFATYHFDKALKQNLRAPLLERLLLASEQGTTWVKEEKADLLIWGEMEEMGTVARIRFLSATSSGDNQPGTFGLADTLDIPLPWPENTGDIVRAVASAALLPVASGNRKAIAERLRALPKAAYKALDEFPPDTPQEYKANMLMAIGNAFATSFRYGDKKALARGIACYGAADAYLSPEGTPLYWALLHSHWGALLEADARVRKSAEDLEVAAKKYLLVTEGLARETNPFDWALAHVRYAMALYKMASIDGARASKHLKAAASSFDEALTVYDRSMLPARWAEVMNHYGVVQMSLGGLGSNNTMLQQAITSFRKALEVRTIELFPMEWAQTTNNLGAACFALAKRTKEDVLFEEAAACFEGAIEVYRQRPGQKKRAKVIYSNLTKVRELHGSAAA